jgi:hypothetical protein
VSVLEDLGREGGGRREGREEGEGEGEGEGLFEGLGGLELERGNVFSLE